MNGVRVEQSSSPSTQITAKRYWRASHNLDDDADTDALTLVFAHATGYLKEIWEPTIEHLYDCLEKGESSSPVRIRDVWAIDAPNHGDAAVLNEEALEWGYSPTCEFCAEYMCESAD